MLNIDIDLNININHHKLPIKFNNNQCVVCAGQGTLKMVDIFGNIVESNIHPLDHITCTNCGSNFSIDWRKNSEGKMIPTACDGSFKRDMQNLIKYPKLRNNSDITDYH
jgi:hypothetical protein